MTPKLEKSLVDACRQLVVSALKELIEQKHLYQSVTLDFQVLNEIAKKGVMEYRGGLPKPFPNAKRPDIVAEQDIREYSDKVSARILSLLKEPWSFLPEVNAYPGVAPLAAKVQALADLRLSTVKVSCSSSLCKGSIQPHNTGYTGLREELCNYIFSDDGTASQVVAIPFQCQNCKGEPLIFLVKRDETKLTLVGRSQFPEVVVPDYFPDKLRSYFRSSIIADQTGFVLAAALYLRTLIEQHFRQSISHETIAAIKGNPTGDELAELYGRTLPAGFPSNFPSLRKAYNDLSEIVHSGEENDQRKSTFHRIRKSVEGHFEAVKLFKRISIQ